MSRDYVPVPFKDYQCLEHIGAFALQVAFELSKDMTDEEFKSVIKKLSSKLWKNGMGIHSGAIEIETERLLELYGDNDEVV